ncbi:MAG: magnesium transporter [Candidatus Pacebacteria bacterium CG_4_10_14_0_8_um_filter_43_12]|nr:MAG: magnesium transporter [Candidatus Pacebacteria bacterium CG10_big_fil_rev_8_21_14_0_10_44_11]PIY78901.1 MAG: magnesium transporter [Candidatus Pacebacteria bacterium CG_4_10_14_0_8_um_filter_43_12]
MKQTAFRSIVHDFSYHPRKRLEIFRALELEDKVALLNRTTNYIKEDLLKHLELNECQEVLERFDPDQATDLIQLLPKRKREKVIATLNESLKRDLSLLLSFDPHTAAGLMNLDYIQVDQEDYIDQIAEKVRTHEQKTGKIPLILISSDSNLKGFLPGYRLVLAKPKDKALDHLQKIATLKSTTTQDQVLKFFQTHPHRKAVVLGEHDNVLGVIYSDDIIRLIQEKESASLYDFAGVRAEESVYDAFRRKVKFRYKWLILNLGTAFLAAFTVSIFQDTIAKQVLLAVYMPIVAGMGGNAGTQTLAVMVRGLATEEITTKTIFTVLRNEVGAGFVNGLINGLIVFTIVLVVNHNLLVGAVLGIAMVVNLLIAASFGTLVPVLMQKLGKDPASSATIFITTATDIFGFLAFLGLATVLLR